MKNRTLLSLLTLMAAATVHPATVRPAQAQSDIVLTKTAPATAKTGESLTYTLEVSTNGNSTSNNVVLSDPLPDGTTFVSANQISGPTFNLSKLPFGATGTVGASASSFGPVSLRDPANLLNINGTLYFSAIDNSHGRELWKTDGTLEGTSLVKDIVAAEGNSNPSQLTNGNGTLYFTADDGTGGKQLWKSDGTEAGTVPMLLPERYTYPTQLTLIGDTLYFEAIEDTFRNVLLKSDGTTQGTVKLTKVRYPQLLTALGDTLYFVNYDDQHHWELWRSDGTDAGTTLVKDIYPGATPSDIQNMTAFGDTLFFTAHDGDNAPRLWKSDGTEAGTTLVSQGPLSNPVNLKVVGNTLYFDATDGQSGIELWKTDGTDAGTSRVKDVSPGEYGSYPGNLTALGNTIYFVARTPGADLYKSDGTEAGTFRINGGFAHPNKLTAVGSQLFFESDTQLCKSDGTDAGTVLVKDIFPGDLDSALNFLTDVNGTLFFSANDGVHGTELWKSDGTPEGTVPVRFSQNARFEIRVKLGQSALGSVSNTATISSDTPDPNPGNNSSTATTTVEQGVQPPAVQNDLALTKTAPARVGVGANLTYTIKASTGGEDTANNVAWNDLLPSGVTFVSATQTGGPAFSLTTPAVGAGGTVTASTSAFGSGSVASPNNMVNVNGTLYFVTNDGLHGNELWKSDGTFAGTSLVKDINLGSNNSDPSALTNVNGTLFFAADDGSHGRQLWKSDGTPAGTVQIVLPAGYDSPTSLIAVGSTLYFVSVENGFEGSVWKSDGTPQGTIKLTSTRNQASEITLTAVGNAIYFAGRDLTNGTELWKSDGTPGGTSLFKDINPDGSSSPLGLTALGNTLFFTANDGSQGYEFWKSDGTPESTVLLSDIAPGAGNSGPGLMTPIGNTLYFIAYRGEYGTELWTSTNSGAAKVQDILPGPNTSYPSNLTAVGNTLFFTATDGNTGYELWKTDSSGPRLVKDILPGNRFSDSDPANLTAVGNTLYFTANDGQSGIELWKSDGTRDGTVQVRDINFGNGDSSPTSLVNVNGTLYFSANDGVHGQELWKTDGTPEGTVPVRISQTASFEITVKLDEAFEGNLANTAHLSSATLDPNPDNNSDTATTEVNTGPTAIALSKTTIPEKQPINTFVAGLSTTASNVGETFSYSLVDGVGDEDNASFTISGVNLRTNAVFDVAVKSSYNIRVRSTDSIGLFFEQDFVITVTEATKPVVTITTPSDKQKILLSNFTPGSIIGTATDNVGVTKVQIRLSRKRGNVNQYWNGVDFVATQSTVQPDLVLPNWILSTNAPPVAKLDAGPYSIQVSASDAAGNKSAYVERSFTLQDSTDSTKPTVAISTPAQSEVVNINSLGANTLTGTASDDTAVTSVKIKLQRKRGNVTQYWNGTDFVPTVTLVDATYSNGSWSYATPITANKLDKGGYTLYATAYDAAGNFKTTPSRLFTVVGTASTNDAPTGNSANGS